MYTSSTNAYNSKIYNSYSKSNYVINNSGTSSAAYTVNSPTSGRNNVTIGIPEFVLSYTSLMTDYNYHYWTETFTKIKLHQTSLTFNNRANANTISRALRVEKNGEYIDEFQQFATASNGYNNSKTFRIDHINVYIADAWMEMTNNLASKGPCAGNANYQWCRFTYCGRMNPSRYDEYYTTIYTWHDYSISVAPYHQVSTKRWSITESAKIYQTQTITNTYTE